MEIIAFTGGELLAFVFGLALGMYVGATIAPLVRWSLARKEWLDASRELELRDEAFERLLVVEPADARTTPGDPPHDEEGEPA